MSEFVRTPSNLLGAMFQVSEAPTGNADALAPLGFRQSPIWIAVRCGTRADTP
jgi:hypothetical protein